MAGITGTVCVAGLTIIRRSPLFITRHVLRVFLPLYLVIRFVHVSRIRNLVSALPSELKFPVLSYYNTRLWLFLNILRMHGSTAVPAVMELRGEGIYTSALDSGKPVILLGLHMGLFELLHKIPFPEAARRGTYFSVVTAPAFSPPLSDFMKKGRREPGKDIITNRDLFSAIRKVVRSKGVLAVMSDQSPAYNGERIILWNAISLPFNPDILQVMLKRNSIVVPLSTWTQTDGKTVLEYHPPLTADAPMNEEQISGFVRDFLEKAISHAPAQWNWSYPGLKIERNY